MRRGRAISWQPGSRTWVSFVQQNINEVAASAETSPRRALGGGREFAGPGLRSVRRLDAQHANAAVGTHDREAVRADIDDLAHLAGDAFRVARRQRLCLKNLTGLA